MKKIIVFASVFCCLNLFNSLAAQNIKLPKPSLDSGANLMKCFSLRKSARNFSSKPLPVQMISEILFAADGINRPDGHKTVPTAMNRQNQTVYAFTADGVYFYNNKKHELEILARGDHRKKCGMQPFHAKAPLVLVYVSDMSAVGNTPEQQALYAGNHSGSASQNVYLYAASQALSTVVCGSVEREMLKKFLKLADSQQVIISQPIGFPAE